MVILMVIAIGIVAVLSQIYLSLLYTVYVMIATATCSYWYERSVAGSIMTGINIDMRIVAAVVFVLVPVTIIVSVLDTVIV